MQRAKQALLRKYISDELIASIIEWKEERNRLIHALMKQDLNTEELEHIADTGKDIIKTLNNKVTSYKRMLEKKDQ